MKRRTLLGLLAALIIGASAISAQTPVEEHPGYFPLEELAILPRESLNVEINLPRSLLKLVALSVDDEPEFADLMSNLEAIRVQIASLENLERKQVQARLQEATKWLEQRDWRGLVRIRDVDEELYYYSREAGGEIAGVTILVLDDEEATIVNLVGKIDLAKLSEIIRGLDLELPELGQVSEDTED